MQVENDWNKSIFNLNIYKDTPLVQKAFKNQTSHFTNRISFVNVLFLLVMKWITSCKINRLLINEN